MGFGERRDPAAEGMPELLHRGRVLQGLGGDRVDDRQRVAHAMVQLVDQELHPLVVLLAGFDVLADRRKAERPVVLILKVKTL